jgi:hypothetical protein
MTDFQAYVPIALAKQGAIARFCAVVAGNKKARQSRAFLDVPENRNGNLVPRRGIE